MDSRLQQDLARFFRVYENDTLEILQKHLSPRVGMPIKHELDEEFELFKASLINRLNEESRWS